MATEQIATGLIALLASAVLLVVIVRTLPPGFLEARTNSRSNHDQPARQIGGLAVVPAMLAALLWAGGSDSTAIGMTHWLATAIALLFAAGAVDDARELSVPIKLTVHATAAAIAAYALLPVLSAPVSDPAIPVYMVIAFVVLVWAVNLVNFMDGVDCMIAAGVGVPAAVIGLAGITGNIPASPVTLLALILAAALVPFAFANRAPASVFLGDNGSLPVGLIAGAIVIGLSGGHSIAAGLLPFAYFVVDSGATLVGRLLRGANIFAAHSAHAYQTAKRAGRSAAWISIRVGIVSCICAILCVLVVRDAIPPLFGLSSGYLAAIALFVHFKRQV